MSEKNKGTKEVRTIEEFEIYFFPKSSSKNFADQISPFEYGSMLACNSIDRHKSLLGKP